MWAGIAPAKTDTERRVRMYVKPNFRTKKELKEAVARGDEVRVFQLGPFPGRRDGTAFVEGPHAPEPHRWYAQVRIEDRVVKEVVS